MGHRPLCRRAVREPCLRRCLWRPDAFLSGPKSRPEGTPEQRRERVFSRTGPGEVYELCGRGIYAAPGKEKLPSCKGPGGILDKAAVKLLTLDFVLAHPEGRYLEDEIEKVSYFVVEQGINQETFPVRLFCGKSGAETRRYFPEKFPMFLSTGASGPLINFTYMEDETLSLRSFSVFVKRYRLLFCTLGGNFELIFVSSSTRNFHAARRVFVKGCPLSRMEGKAGNSQDFSGCGRWQRKSDSRNLLTRMSSIGDAE